MGFFFFFLVSIPFLAVVLGFPWVTTLFPLLARLQGSQFHDTWGWLVSTVLSFWSHGKFKDEKWPKLAQTHRKCLGFDRKRWSLFPVHQSMREWPWELLASKWQQKGGARAKIETVPAERWRDQAWLAQAAVWSPAHTFQLKACPSRGPFL